jgi:hypothetical protein
MRKLTLLISFIISGCATSPTPVYSPPPNCINVPGEGCKQFNAGNKGGTTLGHHNDEDLPAKAAAVPR